MNKMFIGGLVVSLLTMSLMIFGCNNGTASGGSDDEPRVIEAKYWGRWVDDDFGDMYFELSETGIKGNCSSDISETYESTAWIVGTTLRYTSRDNGSSYDWGIFTSDTTLSMRGGTFTKQ